MSATETTYASLYNRASGAARKTISALNDFTLAVYFQPKQTLIEKPIAAVKSAHATLSEKAEKALPDFVPRDKTTRNLVAFSAAAYLADTWDPLPIGETIAAATLSVATARGGYLVWKNSRNGANDSAPAVHKDEPHHGLEFVDL